MKRLEFLPAGPILNREIRPGKFRLTGLGLGRYYKNNVEKKGGLPMEQKKTLGLMTVTGCYVLWGVLAIFWRFLAQVNSVYVLAQRIIWSLVFMGLYLLFARRGREVAAAFRDRKTMVNCLLCGVLITLNWGMYIYAVNSGHVLQASMGYFIEPVAVGLIGVLAFREKPSPGEKVTFLCAGAGIVFLTVRTGSLPVLALMVAIPFAIYGALKKKITLTAQTSLFMETLWMTPLALAFSGWWTAHQGGTAAVLGDAALWLLPASGVVTSVPLLLFNLGVREIPYYFSGILMYINPTLQFLVGLLYFGEALQVDQLIAFAIIWAGISVTMVEKGRRIRRERAAWKEGASGG